MPNLKSQNYLKIRQDDFLSERLRNKIDV